MADGRPQHPSIPRSLDRWNSWSKRNGTSRICSDRRVKRIGHRLGNLRTQCLAQSTTNAQSLPRWCPCGTLPQVHLLQRDDRSRASSLEIGERRRPWTKLRPGAGIENDQAIGVDLVRRDIFAKHVDLLSRIEKGKTRRSRMTIDNGHLLAQGSSTPAIPSSLLVHRNPDEYGSSIETCDAS